MRDKVIQKTMLPRTLFLGQRDPDVVAKQNAMAETISKTMAATLTNHNEVFIRSLTNVMKEVMYIAPIHQTGPA
jgi:hypothetical protein